MLLACGARATCPEPTAPLAAGEGPTWAAWLAENTISLATDDPSAAPTDLAPLSQLFAGTTVVSMGEATHGTREFMRIKDRLFRYLVEHHDFRVVAMEVNYSLGARIDRYITTGRGDPIESLRQDDGYWWSDAAEIVELIEWMRAYNVDHPQEHLRFVGIDVQAPRRVARDLEAMLVASPSVSATELAQARAAFELDATSRSSSALANAMNTFRNARDRASRKGSATLEGVSFAVVDEHILQLQDNAEILLCHAAETTGADNGCDSNALRDRLMAKHAIAAVERSGKTLVWAHNGHVAKAVDEPRTTGSWLAEQFGSNLRTIGFEFNHGGFVAPFGGDAYGAPVSRVSTRDFMGVHALGIAEFQIDPAPRGMLADDLLGTGHAMCVVSWHGGSLPPHVAAYLDRPNLMHSYGGFPPFMPRHFDVLVPAQAFDALIFVKQTNGFRYHEPGGG